MKSVLITVNPTGKNTRHLPLHTYTHVYIYIYIYHFVGPQIVTQQSDMKLVRKKHITHKQNK